MLACEGVDSSSTSAVGRTSGYGSRLWFCVTLALGWHLAGCGLADKGNCASCSQFGPLQDGGHDSGFVTQRDSSVESNQDAGLDATGDTADGSLVDSGRLPESGLPVDSCTPTTCAALGQTCGSAPD